MQARTINADQIRYDSLSFFRVTDLHPYNQLLKKLFGLLGVRSVCLLYVACRIGIRVQLFSMKPFIFNVSKIRLQMLQLKHDETLTGSVET
jgi:hypothetical protein